MSLFHFIDFTFLSFHVHSESSELSLLFPAWVCAVLSIKSLDKLYKTRKCTHEKAC